VRSGNVASRASLEPVLQQRSDPKQLLVDGALELWELPRGAAATLINISENHTYRVDVPQGPSTILRVHRSGYRSQDEIAGELAWTKALRESGALRTPSTIPGIDGQEIQLVRDPTAQKTVQLVMFEFVDGEHPDDSQDIHALFGALGGLAARAHNHSANWRPPVGFTRPSWNLDAVFGSDAPWGNWRSAPNVDFVIEQVLERAESTVIDRLKRLGAATGHFGLIHADMRLANLLVEDGQVVLIDFDDCGHGWHLFDFAAAVSFMECDAQVSELFEAWANAYRKERELGEEMALEWQTFVMMRRLSLLAWVGSRRESTEPQQLAGSFATDTASLAEGYLSEMG